VLIKLAQKRKKDLQKYVSIYQAAFKEKSSDQGIFSLIKIFDLSVAGGSTELLVLNTP